MSIKSWVVLARHDEPAPAVEVPEPAPVVEPVRAELGANGFPENTPVVEMTAEQQAAYYKFQSRKHEDRYKSLGLKDPAELAQLRESAKELEGIREANKSDLEKALAEAEKRGRTETAKQYSERIARLEFKAAAAGRIPDVDGILGDLNMAKFVGDDGETNGEAIAAAVERFVRLVPAAPEPPKPPTPDLLQGVRSTDVVDFRTASKEAVAAELAKFGVKPLR